MVEQGSGKPQARGARMRPLTILAVGNGESAHVVARTQCFAKRGHNVFLLTTAPHDSAIEGVEQLVVPADLLASRPRLRRIHARSPQPFRGLLYHSLGVIQFLRAVRTSRPDIIHVHYAHQYYGWIASLLGSRPLAVTVMGSDVAPFEERDSPETLGEWLILRLLRAADYITPPSEFLVEVIDRLGDFREKTERVVWGIPLDKFKRRDASDLRNRLGLEPTARVVVSPKLLRPFYRIHLLVEAMAIVRRSCPDAVLVMSEYIVDDEYREQIVRRIEELDLGNHAVFSGVTADADMPAFYSMAEISIAIPPRDGMPQALFESLACGTPQILSRLRRYEEIVRHEESAYFVDPNPESIAAGIIRLLDDTALGERIARQGREIVEKEANLDEQAEHVERRFREVLEGASPRTFRTSALLSSALAGARAYAKFRSPRRRPR